jgi:hypothetical protein
MHMPAPFFHLLSTGAVMKKHSHDKTLLTLASLLLAGAALTGCQLTPTTLSETHQQEIRTVADQFTTAIRSGDAARLRDVSTADAQNQDLAQVVINDTVTSRKMLDSLSAHFGYIEDKPGVVGSNRWVDALQSTASRGAIRSVGDRALLAGNEQGEIYLRNVGGSWKVDLIPTLVPESGGNTIVNDPVVEYRFGVTHKLNQWMLARLENNEFQSKSEFDQARSKFWMEYLTYVANGKDPQDALLPSLPSMPTDDIFALDNE